MRIKNSIKFIVLAFLTVHFLDADSFAQYEAPGFELKPELQTSIKWMEKKLGRKVSFEFAETAENFQNPEDLKMVSLEPERLIRVSSSLPKKIIIRLDKSLQGRDKEIELLAGHLLLHLRLNLESFPGFYVGEPPCVMTCPLIPDPYIVYFLQNTMRHFILKEVLAKENYYELFEFEKKVLENTEENLDELDLPSQTINYVRAILEFKNKEQLEKIRQVYIRKNKLEAVEKGEAIADLIKSGKPNSPVQFQKIFLEVLNRLYSPAEPFAAIKSPHSRILPLEPNLYQIFPACTNEKSN